MDYIYRIQLFTSRCVVYPTFHADSYTFCFSKSLEDAENCIHTYLSIKDKETIEDILFFSVEEFNCDKFENFPYCRNRRIYDNTGKLIDGDNHEGHDVKIKDKRFEVGELVEAVEGEEVHIGMLVGRKKDDRYRHIVVGVNDVYYVNYTILKPRNEVPDNVFNKIVKCVKEYYNSFEIEADEKEIKEKYLSFCHCFKGETECPGSYNGLNQIVWSAEKAIFSYPINFLNRFTPYIHDREIIKYIFKFMINRDKYSLAEQFIEQMATTKKRELYKVLHGHYPIK